MLASFPASMVNQKSTDLGIPNRFSLNSSRFRRETPRQRPKLFLCQRVMLSQQDGRKCLANVQEEEAATAVRPLPPSGIVLDRARGLDRQAKLGRLLVERRSPVRAAWIGARGR